MVLGVNMKIIEIKKQFPWSKSINERVILKPGDKAELEDKKADSWIKAGLAVEAKKEIKKQAEDAGENKLGQDGYENKLGKDGNKNKSSKKGKKGKK